MDIQRLLLHPDDGGWFVIGETSSDAELQEFRKSLKRNAIVNTHIVNCTMNHENFGVGVGTTEHKMKVQWTKCTSVLCHPKKKSNASADSSGSEGDERERQNCPVQLRMSTCLLTQMGIVCQAYQHISDEHDSAEPAQSYVTSEMKARIVQMLRKDPEVKPMSIYKALSKMHGHGEFGEDLMPTKIQLRNALTYLRSRTMKNLQLNSRKTTTTNRMNPRVIPTRSISTTSSPPPPPRSFSPSSPSQGPYPFATSA
jgi:hypothetical protein